MEPVTVSMALGIDADAIRKAGAIDVTLNCDTNLFIDPLLIAEASDHSFRDCASKAYRERFELLIELLSKSKKVDDVAWRAAKRLLHFHEVRHTHLGYSSGTSGSGMGKTISDGLLITAKEVIDLGIDDPDLFVVLALIEDGIGADRISDMTTNIIIGCLASFSEAICSHLGLPTKKFKIDQGVYDLYQNPLSKEDPVIFVPNDVVRDLPIAADWPPSVAPLKRRKKSGIG